MLVLSISDPRLKQILRLRSFKTLLKSKYYKPKNHSKKTNFKTKCTKEKEIRKLTSQKLMLIRINNFQSNNYSKPLEDRLKSRRISTKIGMQSKLRRESSLREICFQSSRLSKRKMLSTYCLWWIVLVPWDLGLTKHPKI
jgi:hypothetical protein